MKLQPFSVHVIVFVALVSPHFSKGSDHDQSHNEDQANQDSEAKNNQHDKKETTSEYDYSKELKDYANTGRPTLPPQAKSGEKIRNAAVEAFGAERDESQRMSGQLIGFVTLAYHVFEPNRGGGEDTSRERKGSNHEILAQNARDL